MPDGQQYISTDPNAGQEYLSTDPNAGSAPKRKAAVPQTRLGRAVSAARDAIGGLGAGAVGRLAQLQGAARTLAGAVEDREIQPGSAETALARAGQPPESTAGKVGYGLERGLEFLAPGGLEERAGTLAAEHLPQLGRFAGPAARAVAGALSTGAVNKLQGGSFGVGAALGGTLGTLGELAKASAPSLAESALGVGKKLRGFGRTPGQALLEETRGIAPETIAESARTKLGTLTNELEGAAAKSTEPTTTGSAVKVVDSEMKKALSRNERGLYSQLHDLRQQLTKELVADSHGIRFEGDLPEKLPASRLLDIKRGVGDLERSWNPEQRGAMKGIVRRVYAALDKELDRAVPESAGLNQRISSLIPVAERAESTARGATLPQRLAFRVSRPTGALAGAGIGSYLGYREGGREGALAGALSGLVIPELLASPSVQLFGARKILSRGPALARFARPTLSLFPTAGEKR